VIHARSKIHNFGSDALTADIAELVQTCDPREELNISRPRPFPDVRLCVLDVLDAWMFPLSALRIPGGSHVRNARERSARRTASSGARFRTRGSEIAFGSAPESTAILNSYNYSFGVGLLNHGRRLGRTSTLQGVAQQTSFVGPIPA
jgi:hypothetical protein